MSDQETGTRPTGDQRGDETTPKEQAPLGPTSGEDKPVAPDATESTEPATTVDDALEADPPASEPMAAPVEKRPPGALPIIGLLAAIGAIGGGGYYIWDAQRAEQLSAAPQAAAIAELQKTLAATTARLAASEARLATSEANFARLSQQLGQDLSDKLAAAEGRLSARANQQQSAVAANQAQGAAAARLATAQSLLGALRQGDDFSEQLAALGALGGDPAHLAALRGAVGTPSTAALSAQFFALAPKLLASAPAAAASAPAPAAGSSATDAIWARAEAIGRKLVHIRGEDAPAPIDPAGPVAAVETALQAQNFSGALKARLGLPAPALVATADWARAVQAKIDAELAARAEIAAALQNLAKTKP